MNAKQFVQMKPYCITYQIHCAVMTGVMLIFGMFFVLYRENKSCWCTERNYS